MTKEEFAQIFTEHEDDFLKFDETIGNRFGCPTKRPDLYAFLLLDRLLCDEADIHHDIIGSAEHDEIFLSVNVEKLAAVIAKEQVIDLIRCGVRWDSECDSLCMFV